MKHDSAKIFSFGFGLTSTPRAHMPYRRRNQFPNKLNLPTSDERVHALRPFFSARLCNDSCAVKPCCENSAEQMSYAMFWHVTIAFMIYKSSQITYATGMKNETKEEDNTIFAHFMYGGLQPVHMHPHHIQSKPKIKADCSYLSLVIFRLTLHAARRSWKLN